MDRALDCYGTASYDYAFVRATFDGRIKLIMSNETSEYDSIVDGQLDGLNIEDEWRYAVREGETEQGLESFRTDYVEYFEPDLGDYEHCDDDDYYYNVCDGNWEYVDSESLEECINDITRYLEIDELGEDDMTGVRNVFEYAKEKRKEDEERAKQAEEEKRRRNGYKVYVHI